MTTITKTLTLDDIGPIGISLDVAGEGKPFLLLHGGGGPDTMSGFGRRLAESRPARVLIPTHAGFTSTARPEGLDTIRRLAALYVALLDDLALNDVTVVGNSIGGWVAVEMAFIGSPRVSGIVLIDAVGIDVADRPVADFFTTGYDEFLELAFCDPDPFRVDPGSLSAAAGRGCSQPVRSGHLHRWPYERSDARPATRKSRDPDARALGRLRPYRRSRLRARLCQLDPDGPLPDHHRRRTSSAA